jgi:hypothetical protein
MANDAIIAFWAGARAEPHAEGLEPHQPCVNRIDFAVWLNRIRVRAKTILHSQIPYRLTAPVWFIRFKRFKGIRIKRSVRR